MSKPKTPDAPAEHPLPQAGGSYLRQADGSLLPEPPEPEPETPAKPGLKDV